jgi:predicted transcriptional regulator
MERNIRLNWTAIVEEAIRRRKELKLSQRHLAAIANVSQPTVSRFEQCKADIQLSSVFAILEVLGMLETGLNLIG